MSNLPVRPLSIPEQIAKHLAESIMAGRYQPGDSLIETVISNTFNVSRAPVREALRILERDGVVQIIPRHGARVTSLTPQELLEAYDVRAVMFGHAAGLFAASHQAEQYTQFKRLASALTPLVRKPDDGISYNLAAGSISSFIADNCGNGKLAALLHQLDFQVARYRLLGLTTVKMRMASLAYWKKLAQAFVKRDVDAAESIGRAMIMRTRREAERSLGTTLPGNPTRPPV